MIDDLTDQERAHAQRLHEADQVGREAEAFLASRLGRHVLDRARAQRAEVVAQLICTDPTDAKAVADLQGKAVLLGLFEEWLHQAIADGAEAARLLTDYAD